MEIINWSVNGKLYPVLTLKLVTVLWLYKRISLFLEIYTQAFSGKEP